MRPRLALLLGALTVPALPLLAAAPAHAANTICVNMPAGTPCDLGSYSNLHDAVAAATASGTTIRVGAGPYADGPYVLSPGVSIDGSGSGTGNQATVLTLPAGAQTYLKVDGATVSDLRVQMIAGNGATGIWATSGSTLDDVVVYGIGSTGSTGLKVAGTSARDARVNLTGGVPGTAVTSAGGSTLKDSNWSGGQIGYRLTGGTDTVSQVSVDLAGTAAQVDDGTLNIDDSVLDLGAGGTTGLLVRPTGPATDATGHANHLTVVGGAAGSKGIFADGSEAGGTRAAGVTVTNSIVRGPDTATSLARAVIAGNTATLSAGRTDYRTAQAGVDTSGAGNLVDVDPSFIDPAAGNYDLRGSSPVVDRGVLTGAALDRARRTRNFDGNNDGVAVPDLGAYELHDITPPNTTITAGPSGPTNDNTPVFTFKSGADATFECQIDTSAYQRCTSPVTTTPLPDGAHSFRVRAFDDVFNVEPTPPSRSFTVDTDKPNTFLTKKPSKRFHQQRVKFKFASDESHTHFECRLGRAPWHNCSSPYRFNVKVGKHRLLVRAVDAAGNADRTPARYKFKRLARPRHHHHR